MAQVKEWLELPAPRRPHFITLYFSDVDKAGHKFGPRSSQVREAVLKVDGAIALLLKTVQEEKQPIDVIIVSDHGMQELDRNKVEYLDDLIDLKDVDVQGMGPQTLLYFKDKTKIEPTYQKLLSQAKHFKVYKREEVPAELHYSKNNRIGDLVITAERPTRWERTMPDINLKSEITATIPIQPPQCREFFTPRAHRSRKKPN